MEINSIILNPKNPRFIRDEKFEKLVQSIKDFPEMMRLRPIVVWHKHGRAVIYVTLEPCLSCLKLIMATGIKKVYFEKPFNSGEKAQVRDMLLGNGVELIKINP